MWPLPKPLSTAHTLSLRRRAGQRWLPGFAFLLVAALLGVSVAAPSFAATPAISVSPANARPGDTLTVNGSNFRKSDTLTLTWDGSASGMPGVRVKGNGSFSTRFVVPDSVSGRHTVGATGGGASASTEVMVAADSSIVGGAPSPTLAPPSRTPTSVPQATSTPVPTNTTAAAPSTPTKQATPVPTNTAVPTSTAVPTRTAVPTTVPTKTAVPTTAPTVAPVGSSPFAGEERQLVSLINGSRAEVGAGPVSIDEAVMAVARWRAEDMDARHYSSHVIPGGSCYQGHCWNSDFYVWDVLTAIGIRWGNVGENLWQGGGPESDVAESANYVFLQSPPHHDNMLDHQWSRVGTGIAYYHWTNGNHVVEIFFR